MEQSSDSDKHTAMDNGFVQHPHDFSGSSTTADISSWAGTSSFLGTTQFLLIQFNSLNV